MAVAFPALGTFYLDECGSLVRETVRRYRAGGMKQAAAVNAAARELQLSPRRVRAYCYSEVGAVLVDEYFIIRGRYAQHLERETARLNAEAQLLEQRRAALSASS